MFIENLGHTLFLLYNNHGDAICNIAIHASDLFYFDCNHDSDLS